MELRPIFLIYNRVKNIDYHRHILKTDMSKGINFSWGEFPTWNISQRRALRFVGHCYASRDMHGLVASQPSPVPLESLVYYSIFVSYRTHIFSLTSYLITRSQLISINVRTFRATAS